MRSGLEGEGAKRMLIDIGLDALRKPLTKFTLVINLLKPRIVTTLKSFLNLLLPSPSQSNDCF